MQVGLRRRKRIGINICRLPCVSLSAAGLAALLFGSSVCLAELRTRRRADGVTVIYSANPPSRAVVSAPPRISEDLEIVIDRTARSQQLDPRLVRAVIQVESAFDPAAVSRKGAQGLMQLMPGTAKELGVRNVFDATENVRGGTRYLRQMLDRFGGDLELALASYNAGPSAVTRYGGMPPFEETTRYVRKVLDLYRSDRAVSTPARVGTMAVKAKRRRPIRVVRLANDRLLITTE